jgi:hypothetical protein
MNPALATPKYPEYRGFSVPARLVAPPKSADHGVRRYAVKPFGNSQKGNVKRWLTWRKAWDKLPLIR